MRLRTFIKPFGGMAATWPIAANAQPNTAADNPLQRFARSKTKHPVPAQPQVVIRREPKLTFSSYPSQELLPEVLRKARKLLAQAVEVGSGRVVMVHPP